jgi:TetR/AcrR family transcriptional regulator, regulator of autoinduction and epiphytic fitness
MARRGAELREHILDAAKTVFLEAGFERTSMDAVAAQAQTSKRSLYAYFPTKDVLFLAITERIHELFAARIGSPERYAEDPTDAITRYCGRFQQLLRWSVVAQTCRLCISEASRLPEAATGLYDAFFGTAIDLLAAYLEERLTLSNDAAAGLAHRLIGATSFPELPRALFALDALDNDIPDESRLDDDVDIASIRETVRALISKQRAGAPTAS